MLCLYPKNFFVFCAEREREGRNFLNYHRCASKVNRTSNNSVCPSLACANNRLIFSRPYIGIISRQTVASPQRDRYSQCYDTLARIRGQQLFRDTRAVRDVGTVFSLAPPPLFLLLACRLAYSLCGVSLSSCDLRHEWALFKGSHEQSYRCACSLNGREAVNRE